MKKTSRTRKNKSNILLAFLLVISLIIPNFVLPSAAELSNVLDPAYVLDNFELMPDGLIVQKYIPYEDLTTGDSVTSGSALTLAQRTDWDAIRQILESHKNQGIMGIMALAAPAQTVNVTITLGPIIYGQNYGYELYYLKDGYDFSKVDEYNASLISQGDNYTPDVCPDPALDPRGDQISIRQTPSAT